MDNQLMAPRTRWMVFLVSTPLVMLVTVGGLIGPPKAAPQQSLPELRILGDVVGLINNAYVEPVDIDKVMDGAMRGLAEGLDPSSAFLVPEEVRAIETKAPLPAGDVGLMVELACFNLFLNALVMTLAAKFLGLGQFLDDNVLTIIFIVTNLYFLLRASHTFYKEHGVLLLVKSLVMIAVLKLALEAYRFVLFLVTVWSV